MDCEMGYDNQGVGGIHLKSSFCQIITSPFKAQITYKSNLLMGQSSPSCLRSNLNGTETLFMADPIQTAIPDLHMRCVVT